MKPTNRKKKIMASFIWINYKKEVYYERTVQVEFPVISLLWTKSQQKCKLFQVLMKFISKTFPK